MAEEELKEINISIADKTYKTLNEVCSRLELTFGEVIDRLILNFIVSDPVVASRLILEDLYIHVRDMNEEQFDLVVFIVLAAIQGSYKECGRQSLKKITDNLENTLNERGMTAKKAAELMEELSNIICTN